MKNQPFIKEWLIFSWLKVVFSLTTKWQASAINGGTMMLFFVGILEMLIVTAWTKVVTKNQIVASGVVTMINILIWYYVLETIVNDINNWRLILLYAFGCALGTVASTLYFKNKEAKEAQTRV